MKKIAYIGFAFLLTGCMIVHARTSHTGHFVYTMTDKETGAPITNGVASVKTQTKTCFAGHSTPDSFFTTTSAATGTNGVADVVFQFNRSRFDWRIETPSHYCRRSKFGHGSERFGCVVVQSDYLDIDTNTVDGLSKLNEIQGLYDSGDFYGFAAKFEPKSVTYTNNVVYRSGSFYPKHNPQPMYSYAPSRDLYLPMKNATVIVSNGVEVTHYKPVDLDMRENLLLPYSENYDENWDGPAGETSDFHVERFSVTDKVLARVEDIKSRARYT